MNFTGWTHYPGTSRDHWDATASVHQRRGDKLVSVTLTRLPDREQDVSVIRWRREPAYSGQRISRNWWALDRQDRRWRIERGHDGLLWMLFGPNGDPWGYRLATTLDESLCEASVWIAAEMASLHETYVAWRRSQTVDLGATAAIDVSKATRPPRQRTQTPRGSRNAQS